jgi:hypothetical protein
MEIRDDWEESVKVGHRRSKEKIREGLVGEFGALASEPHRVRRRLDGLSVQAATGAA